jgi:hypothetical protein
MPTQTNLNAWKGNPFSQEFRFKSGDGAGVDLTGRSLKFFLAWPTGSLIKEHGTGGWAIADQSDETLRGTATLSLTKDEVLALPVGKNVRFEIEIDDETWLYGLLVVERWAANND